MVIDAILGFAMHAIGSHMVMATPLGGLGGGGGGLGDRGGGRIKLYQGEGCHPYIFIKLLDIIMKLQGMCVISGSVPNSCLNNATLFINNAIYLF